jgi:small-conductance mechanosensitive channel
VNGIFMDWPRWAVFTAMLGAVLLISIAADFLLIKVIKRIARQTGMFFFESFIRHCRKSLRLVILLIIFSTALPLFSIPLPFNASIERFMSSFFIIAVAWLLIKITFVLEDLILNRYKTDSEDNLHARKIYTQVQFLKKAAIIVMGIVASGTILMTFESFRRLGTSILASAGIAGIVIGLAAQRYIGTLLAGLQIAITQPIRIDDVVLVEKEYGRIEEITLTYVVVRIWDLRRLVLPITYFTETPFQNWTRITADMMGTVFLYVDYTVPVQEVREELNRILKNSPNWDHNVSGLLVTNATEHTMELRALVSASDSPTLWNLRCEVREKLIEFIRENYPDSFPKVRAELLGMGNKKDAFSESEMDE